MPLFSCHDRLARGADLWLPERALEPRPFGAGRDFCSDGRPRFTSQYGGRIGMTFDQLAQEFEEDRRKAEAAEYARIHGEDEDEMPKRRQPLASSLKSGLSTRPLTAGLLWPIERLALEGVPPLRRRLQCPPQVRIRNSPRQYKHVPQPILCFSLEKPRQQTTVVMRTEPPPRTGSSYGGRGRKAANSDDVTPVG